MATVDVELPAVVAAIRAASAPGGMTTRFVAVDGPGGAGKSSLAAWLAAELEAPVIHTDDFASWENPVNWWPQLIRDVLVPLAAGKPARYRPTNGARKLVVEPSDFVVLEGVTASREAFRPYLAYSIWIETPRELRLRRGLERDGEQALADWERWMAGEDRYVERERPAEHADCVLRGDRGMWTSEEGRSTC